MFFHRYLIFWLLILFCVVDARPQTYNIPSVAKAGDPGFISSELIYSLDAKPTPQCHASTLVELPSGLMAAWFGGTHERNADVGIWTSHLHDGQWSHPVMVANGFVNDSLRYPCW